MDRINRVAIVGGTHGNEFTGAYLIKKFESFPHLVARSSFETLTLFGNPKAFELNRRYIDKDLNRCFFSQDLENLTLSSYEDVRARDIQEILGVKGKSKVDVVMDLHSTTANMGLSLILGSHHPLMMQLAAYLSATDPSVKVCCPQFDRPSPFLRSLCEFGFVVEVGSVAQGVLNAEWFFKTEKLLGAILDYLDKHNSGLICETEQKLSIYQYCQTVDYPRNALGEIQGMVHPDLQFRDYEPLHPGSPMFLTFDGREIVYEGESTAYPVFINEAAYYEKGIAMTLTQKLEISI